MAFDALQEDYQRLSLQFARTLMGNQSENMHAFSQFAHRYATARDTLPQTDADRAFYLVAKTTKLIDYELPFASDEAAETIVLRAHNMLDEALTLDDACYDALRMRQAADAPNFDAQYSFLQAYEHEVEARCREAQTQALHDNSPERVHIASSLAMLPYLRWLAALTDKAVTCGRNREALRYAQKAFELDATDYGDLRFTAAFAYAKLENDDGLEQLAQRMKNLRPASDAWLQLARICLAHARRDFSCARHELKRLVGLYPHAAMILAHQQEFPGGIFARVTVAPYSEDELAVAVSEATVLLQEGRDDIGHGVFGSWILQEALSLIPPEHVNDVIDLIELLQQRNTP